MKRKYSGPNRRLGPKDRRKRQEKPIEGSSQKGWSPGSNLLYKRKDAITGKITYSKDQRIRPKDRRKK